MYDEKRIEKELGRGVTPLTGLQRRLVSWLVADGWKVQDLPQETGAWCVLVEDRQGRRITVGHAPNKLDVVYVSGNCTLDPQRLTSLTAEEKQALYLDMGLMLVQMGLDHQVGLDSGGAEGPPQGIAVGLPVYSEGLARKEFAEAIRKVFHGVFAVLAMGARRLGPSEGHQGTDVSVEAKVN